MRLTALSGCTLYDSPKTLSEFSRSCCGVCYIGAKNVDVYYWPEPGADKSCLSIIGDEVNPVTDDTTTESGLTYWGCTAKDPTTSVLAPDWLGSTYIWTSSMTVQSVITIAQMTNIGPITFKLSLHNPWSPPVCLSTASSPQKPTISLEAPSIHASIHARGHSLVIPASVTQENGLPVSIVVSGQFTL